MHKFMTLLATLLLTASLAAAQVVPSQSQTTIALDATVATWAVPAAAYGPLLSIQTRGMHSGATLKVEHLIPFTGGVFTNEIEAAAAANALSCYPSAYLATQYYATNDVIFTYAPPKPVWLGRGDSLLLTLSATNTTATTVVLRTGIPGGN